MDDVELALFERQVEALEKIAEHLEYLTGSVDALSIEQRRKERPEARDPSD